MSFKSLLSLVSIAFLLQTARSQAGSGKTTRYWDCCKPSCGWPGKADVLQPVQSCNANGSKLTDPNVVNGCGDGGAAFTCTDNQPWAVDENLAYGFAAVSIAGSSEAQWCCECYELTFTSGPVSGKKMVVQATNTGGDLGENHFDLLMPGGGVGIFNGCPAQFGSWNGGAQYGGVSDRSQCDGLPEPVRQGCNWRFDWFMNADNPTMTFAKTTCPIELVQKSGCLRTDASTGSTPPPPPSPSPGPEDSVPSPPPTTGDAAHWTQCGGINWSGPTTCEAPYSCQVINDYYSQCL